MKTGSSADGIPSHLIVNLYRMYCTVYLILHGRKDDMVETACVIVRILADSDDDTGDLARLTAGLRAALRDLDVLDGASLTEEAPQGAKGAGAVLGWLSVTIGGEFLKAIADRVATWATSVGRTVEMSVDGDTLKLGRVTRAEQQELVREFLARHHVDPTPGSAALPTPRERGYR